MRLPFFISWLFALGVLASCALGPLAAQESPLVPPWGQDLEDERPAPVEMANAGEPAERRHKVLFGAEYLLWWTKTSRIPPLLTTGPTSDLRPGAIDSEFTRILYGDAVDFEDRHGGRFSLEIPRGEGAWSIGLVYFFLSSRDVGLERDSPGNPVLARPFFNVLNQQEDSSLTTYPGFASGAVSIISDSVLHGGEANIQVGWQRAETVHLTLLAGFRYLDLHENLTILETSVLDPAAPIVQAGQTITVWDRFEGRNDFYGGQVGAILEVRQPRWILHLASKVALGNVHETLRIRGRTTVHADPMFDEPAGLLALATNSGTSSRNAFAVVPEVTAKLGLRLSERCTFFGGYTFMAWTDVVRPGDQIDRNLNPNLIPTSSTFGSPAIPAQPTRFFRTSDYWAQGMTLGFEIRY